jgi:hypothetical protein
MDPVPLNLYTLQDINILDMSYVSSSNEPENYKFM